MLWYPLILARLATCLLALVMLIPSGAIGDVSYLCLMDGQVHSECCCKEAQAKADDACDHVVRADDCCEVCVTKADHAPTWVEASKHQPQPVPLLAKLPVVAQVQPWAIQGASLPPRARGPPRSGPPFFIRNCSYLI